MSNDPWTSERSVGFGLLTLGSQPRYSTFSPRLVPLTRARARGPCGSDIYLMQYNLLLQMRVNVAQPRRDFKLQRSQLNPTMHSLILLIRRRRLAITA